MYFFYYFCDGKRVDVSPIYHLKEFARTKFDSREKNKKAGKVSRYGYKPRKFKCKKTSEDVSLIIGKIYNIMVNQNPEEIYKYKYYDETGNQIICKKDHIKEYFARIRRKKTN
jgi:hypothetical protein